MSTAITTRACQGCGAVAHIHDEDLAPLAKALADATGDGCWRRWTRRRWS